MNACLCDRSNQNIRMCTRQFGVFALLGRLTPRGVQEEKEKRFLCERCPQRTERGKKTASINMAMLLKQHTQERRERGGGMTEPWIIVVTLTDSMIFLFLLCCFFFVFLKRRLRSITPGYSMAVPDIWMFFFSLFENFLSYFSDESLHLLHHRPSQDSTYYVTSLPDFSSFSSSSFLYSLCSSSDGFWLSSL